ncbi:hypothetical protein ATG71_1415 [Bacillus sp. es.034]|nr:hypothetical protein [Bacillus sp. es.034]PFG04625.1 hypothetical protein ATG71_1415 [Bacillus sp. es.034]
MNRFVERVEPYFLSEDPFVQRYAIEMLEGSYMVDGDTFLTGLKAHDRGQVTEYSSPVLPYLMYIPLNEEGMKEVINRLKSLSKKDTDVLFYIQLLANADTELLIKYSSEVKPYIDEGQLKKIAKLPALKDEELFMELADIMFYLDTNDYDQVYFDHGKRIVHELVKRGEIKIWEVQIEEDELVGFELVYTVYMAGEIREESVIPQLVNLFKNEEAEDLLLEEAANALVKIGTDQVVREVEKVALYGNTYFYTLDVLGRIKSVESEQALLRLFDQTDDITAKTLISDYLCQQLSTDSIPKIKHSSKKWKSIHWMNNLFSLLNRSKQEKKSDAKTPALVEAEKSIRSAAYNR